MATPTKADVANSPGDYAGQSWDPVILVVPYQAVKNFGTKEYSGPMQFGSWFAADPAGAAAWFKSPGMYGAPLNIAALAESQIAAMGGSEHVKTNSVVWGD